MCYKIRGDTDLLVCLIYCKQINNTNVRGLRWLNMTWSRKILSLLALIPYYNYYYDVWVGLTKNGTTSRIWPQSALYISLVDLTKKKKKKYSFTMWGFWTNVLCIYPYFSLICLFVIPSDNSNILKEGNPLFSLSINCFFIDYIILRNATQFVFPIFITCYSWCAYKVHTQPFYQLYTIQIVVSFSDFKQVQQFC